MKRPGVYTLEERQAIARAVLAAPAWKEDAHGCYLQLSPALVCKAGDEWLRVEGWLKGPWRRRGLKGVAGLASPWLVSASGVAGLASGGGWLA